MRSLNVPPWFPPQVPSAGSTLPFTGSSEASSPASAVLWRCATPCAPGTGLGFLRPALPCAAPVVSLPAVQNAQPRAWGSSPVPTTGINTQGGNPGPPKFLGNPQCCYARVFDPGRTANSSPERSSRMAPVRGTTKAPALDLSRLMNGPDSLLSTLRRVSYPTATQDSLPGAG